MSHEKKFWINEIPTRRNCGHTKYPCEKISDPNLGSVKVLKKALFNL